MPKRTISNKNLKIANKKMKQAIQKQYNSKSFPISYRIVSGSFNPKTKKDTRLYQEQRYGKPVNSYYKRKIIKGKSEFVKTKK